MSRRLLLALALATAALGEPSAITLLDPVQDLAAVLPSSAQRILTEKLHRLQQAGVPVVMVVTMGDHGQPDRLDAWREDHANGLAAPAVTVVWVNLGGKEARVVPGTGQSLLSPALCASLEGDVLRPILGQGTEPLTRALSVTCDRIAQATGVVYAAAPAAPEGGTFEPVPPREWLNPWWFVALPTLFVGLLFALREGYRTIWLLPGLGLLYTGLFLLLQFQPELLPLAAAAGATPLLFWFGTPPARGVPLRTAGAGGFGVTGFGGLGADAYGEMGCL